MSTVRPNVRIAAIAAVAILAAWLGARAGEPAPEAPKPAGSNRVLQMQTAFNPNLPGAGEGVRTFVKTLKHISDGGLVIKIIEPGRVAPTRDMLDAVVNGDLEAAFTWSGYAAEKAPVLALFATVPFGPGPEEMTSWILEGDGGRLHREAYAKLGVAGIPCGMQGPKGGGWFRGDLDTVQDFKGERLRYGSIAAPVIERMGATVVPLPAGEFFYQLQQGKVDGGEMSTPAMDAALGFDKLGLPYYMPGWQQPSSVLDFLMRKDKWQALPPAQRAQIQTACRANITWMLSRSTHTQALALEKLRAAGVTIKQWSPELLDALRRNTEVVLKERADADPEFAAAWENQKKFVAQSTDWRSLSRLP
ncbi:TRAP-type mannitol/chloroaromatic compound transport system, substrate-binding protein [Enhydrobacter aerosaccus]|uniref:TRAP-type mannitol/chloroaromatic compound transport system, substrate-binding protein n=1 Tax=Enhydrobacter aerosaccus TaxID=225324 RepID=A0A1T4K346_9HYPH|nr:TRAP-type mannitol/chloroaromatic compound transport system, substrate-binding protein [Enhydrobacter aerosaccus]